MNHKAQTTSFLASMAALKLKDVALGVPLREFKPLKVKPHPRQRDLDAYRSIPSRWS